MTRCQFRLDISPKQCQRYYSGHALRVTVVSEQGLRLAFPASELRRFVTRRGVQGRFEIVFNEDHKLVSLTMLTS
ncbi:MAG: DUF2835 domain-containing protein [Granulosicoccus sp.]